MQSDTNSDKCQQHTVYWHIRAHTHTHTNIGIACKLATVLGFWLLGVQCQAILHFSRPPAAQLRQGSSDSLTFDGLHSKRKKLFQTVVLSVKALRVCVCAHMLCLIVLAQFLPFLPLYIMYLFINFDFFFFSSSRPQKYLSQLAEESVSGALAEPSAAQWHTSAWPLMSCPAHSGGKKRYMYLWCWCKAVDNCSMDVTHGGWSMWTIALALRDDGMDVLHGQCLP